MVDDKTGRSLPEDAMPIQAKVGAAILFVLSGSLLFKMYEMIVAGDMWTGVAVIAFVVLLMFYAGWGFLNDLHWGFSDTGKSVVASTPDSDDR